MTDDQHVSSNEPGHEPWTLRLYVAGQTPKSVQAFSNLKQICDEHLRGRYRIEVIDLLQNPTNTYSKPTKETSSA